MPLIPSGHADRLTPDLHSGKAPISTNRGAPSLQKQRWESTTLSQPAVGKLHQHGIRKFIPHPPTPRRTELLARDRWLEEIGPSRIFKPRRVLSYPSFKLNLREFGPEMREERAFPLSPY